MTHEQALPSGWRALLFPLWRWVSVRLRGNRPLTRLLFGVRAPGGMDQELWDWTSLVLARASLRHPLRGLRVLDLGTGAIAMHGIRMARRGAAVVAVDVVPSVAASARRALRLNGLASSVPVVCCDHASAFRAPFDLVCFNAVYVPTSWGRRFTFPGVAASQHSALTRTWDGGPDGCSELRRLLVSLPGALAPDARAFIGINTFYVSDDTARRLLLRAGFSILRVHRLPLNPARVYEIACTTGQQVPAAQYAPVPNPTQQSIPSHDTTADLR